MRERVSPKTLVSNLQSQVEQLPHIANMTRDLLERLSRPHASDPPNPWRENRDGWALRLIGSALLAGGVIQGWVISEAGTQLPTLAAWPAAIMLIAGLYLIVRR